jgi:chromosome segregation ATPase
VSLHDRIAELRSLVEEARSMPMSSSAVVTRGELLAKIDALAEAASSELAEAADVVSTRDDVVDRGHREAGELLAEARDEQQRMASGTEVLQQARAQAAAELASARQEADELRRQADDYVDLKLAGFEVALERSLDTVRKGRERLSGSGALDMGTTELGGIPGDDVPLPGHLED